MKDEIDKVMNLLTAHPAPWVVENIFSYRDVSERDVVIVDRLGNRVNFMNFVGFNGLCAAVNLIALQVSAPAE